MDRNSFVLYLQNIRDLEIAKAVLKHKHHVLDSAADANTRQLELTKDNSGADRLRGILFLSLAVLMLLGGAALLIWRSIYIQGVYLGFFQFMMRWCGFLLLALGAATLIKGIIPLVRAIKERSRVRKINAKVLADTPTVQAQIDKLVAQRDFYEKEIKKIDALLVDAYSLDVLPAPYRNLHSVYYIHEYMSTSKATLEDTLLHEHMENGFQRVLSKLDTIIEQNERLIRLQRLNNVQISAALTACKDAEVQAKITNQYLRANAYFQQASYLA